MAEHSRAGSHQIFGMGGMVQRECSCGKGFTGSAEASFTERDAHIAEANLRERSGCDKVHVVVVGR